jgi:hypothetical protein
MKQGDIKRGCLAWLLALACGSADVHAAVPAAVADALRARAASKGEVRLIVQFAAPGGRFAELPAAARASREQQIASLQTNLANRALQPGMRELGRFRTIPFMVFSADAHAVDRLANLPEVIGLQEDIPEYPTLASSIPIIGADTAWTAGYDGTGQVIAVLDTGVNTSHPYFPPAKLVAEACFSTNSVVEKSQSLCPGQASSSTAAGSGQNCPANVIGCTHGTHVAGIAVGNNGTGPNIGVAKGAGLITVQVFSCLSGSQNCTGSRSAGSFPSDQILALEHVLLLSSSIDIAAVNMSLGTNATYSDQVACNADNAARKDAIDNLRAVGIATVIASGNSGSRTGLSRPGCISTAISVGNTTDADDISSNSNVADFLTLLAPGTDIISAAPGGLEVSNTGTSMSAPHVAGAWAVVRQAHPAASINDILQALRLTATSVNDQRMDGTVTDMRRINLDLALGWLDALEPEIETNPVSGSELDFGQVRIDETSVSQFIALANTGDGDLLIQSCDLQGAEAGSFNINSCPATIPASTQVELELQCQPQATGALAAQLHINSNDTDEALLSFELTCEGLPSDKVFVDSFEQTVP